MSRTLIAVALLAAALAGAAAAWVLTRDDRSAPALERATLFATPRPLPGFELQDQAGGRFDPERLRGRWTLLFFGFTHCPDVCPTTLALLAEARRALADLPPQQRPGVALVSVDPGRDTPAALARYLAHFDPAFIGVTGSEAAITALTRDLGIAVIVGAPAATGDYTVDHSAAIYLVDPTAALAALFGAPHDGAALVRDYRRILAARGG